MLFNLPLDLGAYFIERQGRVVIVVYSDIKLCREKILESSGINPGVCWTSMDMAEQLPYIVMVASIKTEIRKVIQIDLPLAYMYAH